MVMIATSEPVLFFERFFVKEIQSKNMEISEEITPDQEKVVEELKRRLIDEVTPKMLEDKSLFYRFSKARDFKLPEAEAMLRKHISWRKEVNIDAILTEYQPLEVRSSN
ncbi:hypothetical protein TNIN_336351 [Trichonephila inaurata madagascariensis]|uniref:CRAL/TRIO N-terminal domain-containing protein n=1 Tax=Trichonephila inaurata madagascariensis TaxID=2747483 RepID=A0A8X7C8B0_9ARAC|nr:hypothetical protein TNIN_336351 [Trichonephila inaurata madagascariensis]